MSSAAARSNLCIDFERCYNFRDIGGYETSDGRRVRCGWLYRAMTPQYMTEADVNKARNLLGIDLIIDLRGPDSPSSGAIELPPVTRRAVGIRRATFSEMTPEAAALRETFMERPPEEALPAMLERFPPMAKEAIEILASQPHRAAVFHCRLGKDRTGFLAAVILKLLGVGDEHVFADFMETASNEPELRAFLASLETEADAVQEPRIAREPVNEGAIRALLARLDGEFGGARAFLLRSGVSLETLEAFEALALEPQ